MSRYIIATLGMSRKKRAWTMIFTSKSKCQYTGVTRKHVRRPRACTWPYKNIDTYRESLLNSSVSFLPWQCLGDSNPAGLFAVEHQIRSCGSVSVECPQVISRQNWNRWVRKKFVLFTCMAFVFDFVCLFVWFFFKKTIAWWKVASASDFFENVKNS